MYSKFKMTFIGLQNLSNSNYLKQLEKNNEEAYVKINARQQVSLFRSVLNICMYKGDLPGVSCVC